MSLSRCSRSLASASPSRAFIAFMLSHAFSTTLLSSAQVSSSESAVCSQVNTSGSAASVRDVEAAVELVALAQLLEQRHVAVGDRAR